MLLQDVTPGNYILIMVLIGLIKSKVGLKILGSTIYGTTEHLEKNSYSMIKQKLLDTAKQDLLMQINSSSKLQTYCLLKHDTERAKYLDLISTCKHKALSRSR